MNKKILLSALMVVAAIAASAQDRAGLSRQVEVTKEYIPDVSRASKLSIVPRIGDTTSLRPERDYSITPMPRQTQSGVEVIAPVMVNSAFYEKYTPFWAKAGIGYPMNSVLDLYGASQEMGLGRWGGYLNHKGSFYNITNDFDQNVSANSSTNSAGLFGSVAVGRMSLDGELGYDHDLYSRYGQVLLGENSPLQSLSTPHIDVLFGDNFTDLSFLNFRIGGSAQYFSDRYDAKEVAVKPFFEVGRTIFGSDKAILRVELEYYEGSTDTISNPSVVDYKNAIGRIAPSYEFNTMGFNMRLGLNGVVDKHRAMDSKVWIFPNIHVDYDFGSGQFVPFLDVAGDVYNNGIRNTSLKNPYYDFTQTDFNAIDNSRRLDFRLGAGGAIGSTLVYKAYVGMSLYKQVNFMTYNDRSTFSTPSFIAYDKVDDMNTFIVGGELEWRVAGRLGLNLAARLYGHDTDKLDHPVNMANFDAKLSLKYGFTHKLSAWAQAAVTGSRYFAYSFNYVDENEYVKVDPTVELNLGLDYKLNKTWGVYAEGHNIGGSKLYPFPHYTAIGGTFNVGVKVGF